MVCTFFGHADAPPNLQERLEILLTDYIPHHDATVFYVGHHGNFDAMVKTTLQKLKPLYPHIEYAVVLAYLPYDKKQGYQNDTIFPETLENVPPKYAIDRRNRWMIKQSDTVFTYVSYKISRTARWREYARKQGKIMVDVI